MSTGRKRYRPLADTSIEEEDDFQSNKFVKLRNRTRLPVKQGRNSKAVTSSVSGSSSSHFRGNVTVTTGTQSSYNSKKGRGNSEGGGGRTYAKASFSTLFNKKEPSSDKMKGSPKLYSRQSDGEKKYQPKRSFSKGGTPNANNSQQSFGKTTPKQQKYKKSPGGSAEKPVLKCPMPTLSYGLQTPEFMKIKEDDSLLLEKREKRRERNKIMRLKTRKGQPLMRGRIELMLEQIKATTSQS